MRSRYSGYALKKVDYIIQTTHPDLKTGSREEIQQFCEEVSFDGLTILEAEGSYVTFKAHLSKEGSDISFTEKSYFEKVDGKWRYKSGRMMSST